MKVSIRIMVGISAFLVLGICFSLAQVTEPPKPYISPDATREIKEPAPGYYALGFRPNQGQPPTLGPGKFRPKVKATPPAAWDWRSNGGGTSVKNQTTWPTCFIFGSIGEVESKIKLQETPTTDPDYSEMDVLEGLEEGTRPPGDPLAGGNPKEIANHLSRYACLNETDNPYPTPTPAVGTFPSPPITNYWNPPKGTGQRVAREWHDLGNMDQIGHVPMLKDIIYNIGPVTASVSVAAIDAWSIGGTGPGVGNRFNGPKWYSDWLSPYSSGGDPDRCILIVGWDDSKSWYGGGGTGAWLVKNSWGTTWGTPPSVDKGYFWIAYASARIGSQAGYYPRTGFSTYDSNETLLHYDEFGSWGAFGWSGQYDIYALNVFTPPDYGAITDVEFWATYPNLYYDVRVFDTWASTSTSPTLQIGGRASGFITDAGYYTVPINPPASIATGNDVYVVVRLIDYSSSHTGLIPVEVDASDTGYTWLWFPNSKSTQTNKCYVRYNTGLSWYNMTPNGDVGVRARMSHAASGIYDWNLY